MSELRYYTDEQVARAVPVALRRQGIDVLTVPEAGMMSSSDEQQLAFALGERRVLFTQDRDFLKLAARGRPHGGIVFAEQPTSIGDIVRGLVMIFEILSAEEMLGAVEVI